MSKGCEMCDRTGVVFKPGMPGLDDKDTCPECGGRGIVESATVPAGERNATADLAMLNKTCRACNGTGVLRSPVAEGECGNCDGTGITPPDEDMVALAEYWIERAEHLEAENAAVRHELDRSRDAHGRAELELARLRTTLASIEEYGTEEINAGIELRQELARLHKVIADATGHSKDGDGVDLLCKALYGRPGQVPDWLGGSEARMLYDAVEEIEELRAEANALDRLRAWQNRDNNNRCFELDGDYLLLCHITNGEWSCAVLVVAEGTFAEVVDAALARWSDLYEQQ